MATPILVKTGSISGPSVAGRGANDLVIGETVTITDLEGANAGASRLTEFIDVPIGSALTVLTNPTSDAPSFVPDVTGSYRVKMTVNGVHFAIEIYAVPLPNTGSRIPSFQEQLEYDEGGQSKGWHEAQTDFMRSVDGVLDAAGIGQTGNLLLFPVWAGGRESHNSDTPLVVGSFPFNPDDYSIFKTSVVLTFRAIVANGSTPLTTHVHLYNLTDGEIVASSALTLVNTTTPTKLSATLVTGASPGEVKTGAEKIYECRIFLDAPPGDPNVDTIELMKAEVLATFTVS